MRAFTLEENPMKKLFFVFFLVSAGFLSAQDIVLGVNPGNAPPYLIGPIGAPTSGIVYDIGIEVGKALGVKVVYKEVSRNRVESELFSGGITSIPILNPYWTNSAEKMIFSPVVFGEKNIFVVPKAKSAGYKTMDSFKGLVIGANIGYFYADPLIKAWESKANIREDVNSPDLNFNKLILGRIGAFVHSDIMTAYELKTNKDYSNLAMAPYILSENDIHWAFAATNKAQAEKISAVLKKLVDNGTVAKILAKYR